MLFLRGARARVDGRERRRARTRRAGYRPGEAGGDRRRRGDARRIDEARGQRDDPRVRREAGRVRGGEARGRREGESAVAGEVEELADELTTAGVEQRGDTDEAGGARRL